MKIHVKIFTAMFAAALALCFSGCTKDSDDPETLIVGHWQVPYVSYTPEETHTTHTSDVTDEEWYFKFREDKTGWVYHIYSDGYTNYADFTYKIEKDKLILTFPDTDYTYSTMFTLEKIDKKEAVLMNPQWHPEYGYADYRIYLKRIPN